MFMLICCSNRLKPHGTSGFLPADLKKTTLRILDNPCALTVKISACVCQRIDCRPAVALVDLIADSCTCLSQCMIPAKERAFASSCVIVALPSSHCSIPHEHFTFLRTLQGSVGPQPAAKSSMVAWFKSEDADAQWPSAVNSFTGRVTRGSITRKVEAGNGAAKPVVYLAGNTQTSIDFGKIMKPAFTICSVTRYVQGGQQHRILTSNGQPNFLHGHWHQRTPLAYYNNWVTPHVGPALTDWLVMCGNSQGVVFAGTERKNIGERKAAVHQEFHLYINEGFTSELSDFGVMEVIVWDRALSEDEMWKSMEYLSGKLQGSS